MGWSPQSLTLTEKLMANSTAPAFMQPIETISIRLVRDKKVLRRLWTAACIENS